MFLIDTHVIACWGYAAVAIGVAMESAGVPFPGETLLIAAALYAGASHRLAIVVVVLAAAMGAMSGGSVGFWAGRRFGLTLLSRYGCFAGITPKRIKLGRYLFSLHGGKVVFLGRFLPYLRAAVAFLAGAGQMTWSRFLPCNSTAAIIWAAVYGGGSYYLGSQVDLVLGPTTIAATLITVAFIVAVLIALRQHEARLMERAEVVLGEGDSSGVGS